MARPRLHSLDDLLDVAEQIVVSGDPGGLTLRGLATTAGVSNGTIYHAFGSKEELLARLWLRASARLADLTVDAVSATAAQDAASKVVAVATAPLRLAQRHPGSARLFFGQRSDQLFTAEIPGELVSALLDLRAEAGPFVRDEHAWALPTLRREREISDVRGAVVVVGDALGLHARSLRRLVDVFGHAMSP